MKQTETVDEISTNFLSKVNADDVKDNIKIFSEKCAEMISYLDKISTELDNEHIILDCEEQAEVLTVYRTRLRNVRESMQSIDERVVRAQLKLNRVRASFQTNEKYAHVESGPFQYVCLYPGGVRFREYPSDIAAILENVPYVRCGQIVNIIERVFVPGESSVFLHCVDKGWLMENRLSTVCFRRIE